ncbi:hypothetical protein Tco_1410989 [Tanacetum coccineum]
MMVVMVEWRALHVEMVEGKPCGGGDDWCLDVAVIKSSQLYVLNGIEMFLGWFILELLENDGSVPIQCCQFISQRFNIKMEKKNIKDLHVLSFGDVTRGGMYFYGDMRKSLRRNPEQQRTIEIVTELVEVSRRVGTDRHEEHHQRYIAT